MGAWLEHNILEILIIVIGGVGGFFALKMIVKAAVIKIKTLDVSLKTLEKNFREHEKSKTPHTNCAVHTANLLVMERIMPLKVDKEVCEAIKDNMTKRLDDLCGEVKNLKDELSPLKEIRAGLARIEVKLDNGITVKNMNDVG